MKALLEELVEMEELVELLIHHAVSTALVTVEMEKLVKMQKEVMR